MADFPVIVWSENLRNPKPDMYRVIFKIVKTFQIAFLCAKPVPTIDVSHEFRLLNELI